jgi:hypothetical protein
MTEQTNLAALVHEIRKIHASSGPKAREAIESYLVERLGLLPPEERLDTLQQIMGCFGGSASAPSLPDDENEKVVAKLFSLILGKTIHPADLSSSEVMQRLAESLNTIFDSLNKIVGLIQSTFSGRAETEETIRQVIGVHVGGEDRTKSLEAYLGRISKAFLSAQDAFKQSGHKLVGDILDELDPSKVDPIKIGSLKFGPLRKAELFDVYSRKLEQCRRWHESGRFMADLQREFEKNCQQCPF